MAPVDIVRRFVTAINAHDIASVMVLMTEDHRFIDSLGAVVAGKDRMSDGWRAYWMMVPDYEIEVHQTFHQDDAVVAVGIARGSYAPDGRLRPEDRWETPAAWRAVVRGDRVAEWQVYADNEPIRRLIAARTV